MSSTPPPPGPAYGGPPAYESSNAVIVLILGILGLVTCQLLGIVAWVMGNSTLARMDAGYMDPSERSLASAGRICGIIATLMVALGGLIALVGFLVMGVFMASASGVR